MCVCVCIYIYISKNTKNNFLKNNKLYNQTEQKIRNIIFNFQKIKKVINNNIQSNPKPENGQLLI